jgi:hypothetical protein
MAASDSTHDNDISGQNGDGAGQMMNFALQDIGRDGLGAITDFLGFFAADGSTGQKAFYDLFGMAHEQLDGYGGQTAEGQSLSSLGELGIVGSDNDIRAFYDVQAGFDGPAVYLGDDDFIAVQDSLGETEQMVLVDLESDSLGGFVGRAAAIDSVDHGQVKAGAEVLSGAFNYYHVALIIMISAGEGLDQFTGHLIGTNADGVVLLGAVQGDVNYLGIHRIMFVLEGSKIGGFEHFFVHYLLFCGL